MCPHFSASFCVYFFFLLELNHIFHTLTVWIVSFLLHELHWKVIWQSLKRSRNHPRVHAVFNPHSSRIIFQHKLNYILSNACTVSEWNTVNSWPINYAACSFWLHRFIPQHHSTAYDWRKEFFIIWNSQEQEMHRFNFNYLPIDSRSVFFLLPLCVSESLLCELTWGTAVAWSQVPAVTEWP